LGDVGIEDMQLTISGRTNGMYEEPLSLRSIIVGLSGSCC
jgi:hypothetical protein